MQLILVDKKSIKRITDFYKSSLMMYEPIETGNLFINVKYFYFAGIWHILLINSLKNKLHFQLQIVDYRLHPSFNIVNKSLCWLSNL